MKENAWQAVSKYGMACMVAFLLVSCIYDTTATAVTSVSNVIM